MLKKGTSSAEKVTVSFHTKSSKTGTYILELYDVNNSRHISKSYTIDSANTWEQKVIVFDADTTGILANDSGHSLAMSWWLGAGSTYSGGTLATTWTANTNANRAVGVVNLADSTSNNWYLTGVQIEVGEYTASTLPPFQHETVQDSQMRCARYCQKTSSANNNFVGRGFSSDGGGRGATLIDTPCPMRAGPTITTSSASTFKFAIGTTGSGNGTGFIVKGYFSQAGMNNGQGFNGNQNFVVWLDISASGLSDGAFTRGVSKEINMPMEYKKLNYPPEIESGAVRTDFICKIITDDSDNVISDSWIPVDTKNADYLEYQAWEAIDGNTISDAD